MHDVVAKKRKRIKRNKFTLVNTRAKANVICTLKKEDGDSEEARESTSFGNKVGT